MLTSVCCKTGWIWSGTRLEVSRGWSTAAGNIFLNVSCIHVLLWPMALKQFSVLNMIFALSKDGFTVCPCALQFVTVYIAVHAVVAVHLPASKISIEGVSILEKVFTSTVLLGGSQRPHVEVSYGPNNIANPCSIRSPKLGTFRRVHAEDVAVDVSEKASNGPCSTQRSKRHVA